MSIHLPGFHGDPGAGDLSGMAALVRSARDHSVATLAEASQVEEALGQLDANRGQAISAATEALTAVAPRLATVGRSYGQVADALDAYSLEVTRLGDDVRSLGFEAQRVHEEMRHTINRLAGMPGSGVSPGTPWNGSPAPGTTHSAMAHSGMIHPGTDGGTGLPSTDQIPTLLARWSALADEYRVLLGRHGDLTVGRSRANVRAVEALSMVEIAEGFAAYRAADIPVSVVAVSVWALNASRVTPERLARLDPVPAALLWASLSEADRRRLVRERPDLIGSTEGIPATDRHTANVAHLREELRRVKHQIDTASVNRTPLSGDLIERLRGLEVLYRLYGSGVSVDRSPPEYLVSLDTTLPGAPLAAVAVGNLDTAGTAVYLVPGMNSSTVGTEGLVSAARTLYAGAVAEGDSDLAVVAWLDYRAPKLSDTAAGSLSVLSDHSARVGAERLVHSLEGYNAVQQQSGLAGSLHVVAHSYGTTTASLALATRDLGVDSFTMLGSAGLVPEIAHARDLHVDNGRVYAIENAGDATADLGRLSTAHPVDPVRDRDFGAVVLGSDGVVRADGTELRAARGHDLNGTGQQHYLSPGTESWANVVNVILGRVDRLTLPRTGSGGP
ncbi:alpha/beta hydrolase [Klugiella xanthotipulae]|uniref:Alpha/beta hydrolase family protein n=1 Tax=Klugiella xanthotipulae TaxID=244735 RepID=A0A543I6E4_9MICO|nr:alpha/beta hydrolase [Klugiella xanthotipulae]TQM66154.1 alpha/beta hydrolase family protein [Klugiella xanthotipulae]